MFCFFRVTPHRLEADVDRASWFDSTPNGLGFRVKDFAGERAGLREIQDAILYGCFVRSGRESMETKRVLQPAAK